MPNPYTVDPDDIDLSADCPPASCPDLHREIARCKDQAVYAVLRKADPDRFPVAVTVRIEGRKIEARIGGGVGRGDEIYTMTQEQYGAFMDRMESDYE